MKYTILINQKQVCDAGLEDETDLVDWAMIDYMAKFYASPKSRKLDDHVWINLKTMISEMPLLGLKSKQALSRRISKQRDLDLITCIYDGAGRMYARITPRCYACIESDQGVNYELTGCQSSVNGGVNSELTGCQRGVDIKQTSNTLPVINKPEEDQATGNLTVIPSDQVEVKKSKNQIPYSAIVDLYHELLPELRGIEKLNETRKRYIKNLFLDDLPDKQHWTNFFNYVRESDFLMGRSFSQDRRPFSANLEWLTKPANFLKISEGQYHE